MAPKPNKLKTIKRALLETFLESCTFCHFYQLINYENCTSTNNVRIYLRIRRRRKKGRKNRSICRSMIDVCFLLSIFPLFCENALQWAERITSLLCSIGLLNIPGNPKRKSRRSILLIRWILTRLSRYRIAQRRMCIRSIFQLVLAAAAAAHLAVK